MRQLMTTYQACETVLGEDRAAFLHDTLGPAFCLLAAMAEAKADHGVAVIATLKANADAIYAYRPAGARPC